MLDELANSTSAKDRRISAMLRAFAKKGEIAFEDYEARRDGTKWSEDMAFALQLGIVEKIDSQRYRILTEAAGTRLLSKFQKKLVRELYDSFGQESFSREMLCATLDYDGPHISAYLHRFTLMRILDCSKGDVYSYRLLVTPVENPECFDTAA